MKTPYRIPPSELESERPRAPVERPLGEHLSTHAPRQPLAPLGLMISFLVASMIALERHAAEAHLLGIAFLGSVAIWFASIALVRLRPTIEIWDRAIVIRRAWTDERVIRFEDIDTVHYDITRLTMPFFTRLSATITITDHDGSRAVLPSGLVDTPSIVRALDRHVTRPLLAPAKRALRDGELLYFDTVVLQEEKLLVEKESLPLDRLDCVEATEREVRFYEKDLNWPPFATVPLHTVPHPKVLLAVLATRVPVEDATGL